ncbi:MAG: LysR substrate-binding domain-containing protein [Candidatus Eisenbacteria bacterium]
METFGPRLLVRIAAEAPGVRLRFLQKPDKASTPLREGAVDLETGVVDESIGPEVRALSLFRDRFVGVTRADHPLSGGRVTVVRYLRCRHVDVRRATERLAIDASLEGLGRGREVAVTVAGFASAIALARATDFVATVPERHTAALRFGMHTFTLPFSMEGFTVSLLWHPRLEADPAHRWLRGCVREICAKG